MTARIDRVDARARLKLRREPYWYRLSEGRYIGFRRMVAGALGVWLARFHDSEKRSEADSRGSADYHRQSLGDFADLPEKERFDAAKRAAEEWFKHLDMGGSTQRSTVKKACEAYVDKLKQENSAESAIDAEGRFRRLVYADPIARVELAKLAPRHLAEWKKRVLTKGGTRGSFNRNATALRAAFNLAYQRREVASNHAWREELKPFEAAGGRRTLYLDRTARRNLIESASSELQPLLRALALLPMRPGELVGMRVEHLDVRQGQLHVPAGKTGSREVPLASEALSHFKECAKNKLPSAWLVSRADGKQWDRFTWRDGIKEAAAAAKLPAATCAYTLRHSTITDLVTRGLDLFTVAKISGTSVTMIEKHYGHLQREHARNALEALALG